MGRTLVEILAYALDAIPKRFHPKSSEWTVIAAIVAEDTTISSQNSYDATNKDGHKPSNIEVLAYGTGTKCLGISKVDQHGRTINDGHAEVVARREFIRYCFEAWFAYHYNHVQNKWFQFDSDNSIDIPIDSLDDDSMAAMSRVRKARLAPGVKLHLIISDLPCGDAALVPDAADLSSDTTETCVTCSGSLHQSREIKSCSSQTQSATFQSTTLTPSTKQNGVKFRATGAKPLGKWDSERVKRTRVDGPNVCDNGSSIENQQYGILRTKSGRSDIPESQRSTSMCCSDKIARWIYTGLQSAMLACFYEPMFLSSITVVINPVDTDKGLTARSLDALKRALLSRLPDGSPRPCDPKIDIVAQCLWCHKEDNKHKVPHGLSVGFHSTAITNASITAIIDRVQKGMCSDTTKNLPVRKKFVELLQDHILESVKQLKNLNDCTKESVDDTLDQLMLALLCFSGTFLSQVESSSTLCCDENLVKVVGSTEAFIGARGLLQGATKSSLILKSRSRVCKFNLACICIALYILAARLAQLDTKSIQNFIHSLISLQYNELKHHQTYSRNSHLQFISDNSGSFKDNFSKRQNPFSQWPRNEKLHNQFGLYEAFATKS